MLAVNNITLSGKITEQPKRFVAEETGTVMCSFKLHNETMIQDVRKTSFTINVTAYGNTAEFVDANLDVGDKVIVSGTIACKSIPFKGYYIAQPYIRALAVSRLEQEMYK
jgi:single-stranded DNA-binding protein